MAGQPDTSERMRRIGQKNTAPELEVRRLVASLGARYRTCTESLPGRPDLSNKTRGWAIFVHGCFWHGHHGCKLYRLPKTNQAFWRAKVDANRRRDARKERELLDLGFRVAVVWQCELRDPLHLRHKMRDFLFAEDADEGLG